MKIGLEVHIALPTKTKLFCGCSTKSEDPNSAICPTCMGFPGSKPMLNSEALKVALSISKALKCKCKNKISFVRKIYFYPDLPKSYQITQMDGAVGFDGEVLLQSGKIRIKRVQIEEDPAKIFREEDYTLLDFNRSGIPLVEIVTEPDISTMDQLRNFINELKSILYYLGVDITGEMKVDLNVSINEGERIEIKNVTGLKNLIDAAEYEIKRQNMLILEGKTVIKETRSYNEKKIETETSREKESDEEYGFIYEPDLCAYNTDEVELIKPIIASSVAKKLAKDYKGNEKTILELIKFDKTSLEIMEQFIDNWKTNVIINVIGILKKTKNLDMEKDKIYKLLEISDSGAQLTNETISLIKQGKEVKENKISDVQIDNEIEKIMNENEKLKYEYKNNPKVFNFIVGAVSKKFKANPRYVSKRLSTILKKLIK